jgi:hypothetical protein
MECPVCQQPRSEEGLAFITHVNQCAPPLHHPLFAVRLHDVAHVTSVGPPNTARGAWPVPPPAAAAHTPSTRAMVLRGGPSYTLAPSDCAAVHPRVLLGSEAVARSAAGLRAANVRAIVNCAGNSTPLPRGEREACGVAAYTQLQLVDAASVAGQDALALIERGADAVADALLAGGGGAVLVHCVAGMSRSAAVAIAFLVKHRGQRLLDAATAVKHARCVAYPNRGFWAALRALEGRVREGEDSVPEALLAQWHREDLPVSTHVFGDAQRS